MVDNNVHGLPLTFAILKRMYLNNNRKDKKNMNEKIVPMLVLSTEHLRPETIQKLEHDEFSSCIYYKKLDSGTEENYGGWLYIADEGSSEEIDKCEDLRAVVEYCDRRHIQWVMFDRDADTNDLLPTYKEEWEE